MMKVTVRQLVLASAMGAFSFAAQAHGTAGASAATSNQNATVTAGDQSTATPKMKGDEAAQAETRYEAAQAACEQQTGDAKATCLRTAATEYENAISGGMPSSAASPSSPVNTGAAPSDATSSVSTEPSGSASGPASMSSGSGTEGAGQPSGAGNGGGG